MEDLQEKFDQLVADYGAEAVVAAVKAHKKPTTDSGAGCTSSADCGKGYYCSNGTCILNVGP